jgi:hypothetical protein
MEAIADLPMLHDMDADYSPQYVKLARILRDKIKAGQYPQGTRLPPARSRPNTRYPCAWPGTRWKCSPPTDTSAGLAVSHPTASRGKARDTAIGRGIVLANRPRSPERWRSCLSLGDLG